mgnify:CR=1 FL=1
MRATFILGSLTWLFLITSCTRKEAQRPTLEEIAGSEEVLAFMKTFDGRGVLSDSSLPLAPEISVAAFRYPGDLKLDLILSEPEVTQPVFINFDHRGRLWVVQYNQYPYPRNLKVMSMDQHIRATFDKIPPPPGRGAKGADKITFFEDIDGDGVFDKSTDAITGLNIATSVALGRGNIWVMNPPYLLAYADRDDNGIPDGPPVVHLDGFGIEDTHAVANNIRWGPDGWLYGAQGSTCTANVSSYVSKNIRFDGQAIWRYHPETKVFEIFAEGGGNTFDVEIDEKGRIYSGDNGTARGQYYKQGAYYVRNFGKHGALTNPYAFGFLSNMELTGEKVRFTHAFVKYEGGGLPTSYDGKMIAINPLQSYVQLSAFESNGSTFRIADEKRIIETDDKWFRPVDITTGPDGGIYIADWYDSRLSHVDPRDTWSKSNGRIYRIGSATGPTKRNRFNLRDLPGSELIKMLFHPNRWFRQQALIIFGDRKDPSLIPALTKIFATGDDPQVSLEALWAIHHSKGFNDEIAVLGLKHSDPFVRMWSVRLVGEQRVISIMLGDAMARLARTETHPEVRSQLVASAKRLPGDIALAIINNLLRHHDDSADPDIPLQMWWALEAKIEKHNNAVLALFGDRATWKTPMVRKHLLERLTQRYAMQADSAGFASCARLIRQAPSVDEVKVLINGLQEGLRGGQTRLTAELEDALKPYRKHFGEHSLAISLRQGDDQALADALSLISDRTAGLAERLACIRVFGEIDQPDCVPVLLRVIEDNQSSAALKQAALQALQRYDDDEIGRRVVKAYPDRLRADPGVRLSALSLFSTRPGWAHELMNAIAREKLPGENFIAHTISKQDVPDHLVHQIKSLNDQSVIAMATRIWPSVRYATSSEKTRKIGEISAVLRSGRGNISAGKSIYINSCGPCHRLFQEGGTLGPDLTGYDRNNTNELLANIVDPGAYVREGYVTYKISTSDGRTLVGTISSRKGTTIDIELLTGETVTLPEAGIKEMRAQPSMMPDNLLDHLSENAVRDLFAYLQSGTSPGD